MTLSTDIYLTGTVDPMDLFNLAVRAITVVDGDPFDISTLMVNEKFKGQPLPYGGDRVDNLIMSSPGQGLPAWTTLTWDPDGRTAEEIDPALSEDGVDYIIPAYDYHLNFDTGYAYNSHIGGCSNLHAVTIAVLDQILPSSVHISAWRNEFTQELFYDTSFENLMDLPQITVLSPQKWHDTYVQPALDLLI